MTGGVLFEQLNHGWNAEPNAPKVTIEQLGADILVRFLVNAFRFGRFDEEDVGVLRFHDCDRYRLGPPNDEGWYHLGECRYRESAPAWGEFYELSGDDSHLDEPRDWVFVNQRSSATRHFLFYFRDNTFECIASRWSFDPNSINALYRVFGHQAQSSD